MPNSSEEIKLVVSGSGSAAKFNFNYYFSAAVRIRFFKKKLLL